MSITQKLVAAYKFWHEIAPHFPKTARYTLGGKIDLLFVTVIECVVTASYAPKEEKLPLLKHAAKKIDVLKFFAQVAWEIKALDDKKYITLSEKIDEVGRMLGGWLRQLANRR